jgi:23S rRNA (cytidine1920-2'-O)/16S rRNA (cytidine1409-2'-O)-methyltransferase
MSKIRLDIRLAELGLAESRSSAQRFIMAGSVRVNGQVVLRPSMSVHESDLVTIDKAPPFVSRGGEKLEAGLLAFALDDLTGKTCVDVGASTGGFTDCLLQHGAVKVFAIDVGYGILHWKLRQDPRVISMERTNARYVEGFAEPVDLVTIDASFISLKTLLPVVNKWLGSKKVDVIALIKPQFEAGRKDAAKGEGVIRDPLIHKRILIEILEFAGEAGFQVNGLIKSPLTGPKGNIEFLVHLLNSSKIATVTQDWLHPLGLDTLLEGES